MHAFSETFGNELQFPVPSVLTHFSVHILKTGILFYNCNKIFKVRKINIHDIDNNNSQPKFTTLP